MTRRIVGWLVLVPLSVVLIIFALANRQTVGVHFDPLGSETPLVPAFEMPLFVVIYTMLILGVLLGGLAVWLTQGRNRREKRRLKKHSDQLQREIDSLRRAPRLRGLPTSDDLLEID